MSCLDGSKLNPVARKRGFKTPPANSSLRKSKLFRSRSINHAEQFWFSQSIDKIADAKIRTGLQEMAAETLADLKRDLIQQFHQTTASFFDLIERHRAQNQELTTLRDWLLPMLMNGQVRVG